MNAFQWEIPIDQLFPILTIKIQSIYCNKPKILGHQKRIVVMVHISKKMRHKNMNIFKRFDTMLLILDVIS